MRFAALLTFQQFAANPFNPSVSLMVATVQVTNVIAVVCKMAAGDLVFYPFVLLLGDSYRPMGRLHINLRDM